MNPIRRCCAAIALAATLLSGCATYEPRPISATDNARALDSRSLDDPRLQQFIAASLSLAEKPGKIGSWNLETLSLAALYYHPDLDIARARLAGARAGVVTAGQVPNPSLDLGVTYNATTTTPSPWTVGLMVNFIVETLGKRQYRTAQAQHLVEAARDDLASATWQVRGRVREALLQHWIAQQRLSRARQRLDRQGALVRLIERRFDLGEASSLDVMRERINRNQASLAVRDAQRQAVVGRAQLAQAVGVPQGALEGVDLRPDDFDAVAPIPAEISRGELREKALTARSDVRGLLAEYAAAQAVLQLQISRQFPNLAIGPGYSYDQGAHKYELAVASEFPIFNQNQGPVAEARARRAEIAARFTALQTQIIGAIDAASASYRTASEALETADALAADARRREASVRRGFEAGQVDRPTLVGAEIESSTAELSRLDALATQRRAIGLLEDALRTPLFGAKRELPVEERNPRVAAEDRR